MYKILAADIGATNSRFGLFRAFPESADEPLLALERELWLKGAEYPSFADVLAALGKGASGTSPAMLTPDSRLDMAVIAPAGPIVRDSREQRCRVSNLPWTVSGLETERLLGIPRVTLINDFVAQAYACLLPLHIDTESVLQGQATPEAPQAVVGAGTGFGTAQILCEAPQKDGESRKDLLARLGRARILPGEGGHAEFPFIGEREFEFARFAAARAGTDRLIGDTIVTGSGLAHVFAFLTGRDAHAHEAAAQAAEHPEVLEWYARFYGRACRLFVTNVLALGGLFVTGGMALRLPALQHPAFAGEFHASAAQREILERVPVWQVRNPAAGLWGAALYGLLQLCAGSEIEAQGS